MNPTIVRWVITLSLFASAGLLSAQKQDIHLSTQIDSDHDGLSDALEQSLLVQFAPTFMIGRHDCSDVPAEFRPDSIRPIVKSENKTIYGEVFPAKGSHLEASLVEVHFYHLWKQD